MFKTTALAIFLTIHLAFAFSVTTMAQEKQPTLPDGPLEKAVPADKRYPARTLYATIKNGLPEGTVTCKYSDGRIISTVPFADGKIHGVSKIYYPNGNVFQLESYAEGEMHGERTYFYPDGKTIMLQDTFIKDVQQGKMVKCYINGKVYSVSEVKDDLKHGKEVLYLKDGTIAIANLWKKGELIESHVVHDIVGPLAEYRDLINNYDMYIKEFWEHPEKQEMPKDREAYPKFFGKPR